MRYRFFIYFLVACLLFFQEIIQAQVVQSTKKISIPNFPNAFNPSIIEHGENYLLSFRSQPDWWAPWISNIGIVLLNSSFELISEPILLNTRPFGGGVPSQSEDARLFSHNGKLYVVYNDNVDQIFDYYYYRRDMFIAEVIIDGPNISLGPPIKLFHEDKYSTVIWQKNWSPFSWNGILLLSYSLNPHEVLFPDLHTGKCFEYFQTERQIPWKLGALRGGTPALSVNGEYLAFFHSGTYMATPSSNYENKWHYFMGAYTFSPEPPFEITKVSPVPIKAKGFYTNSDAEKRVIYPGGFVIKDSTIYLAYGKDDREVWIATIDLQELLKTLIKVN